jgi:hypothetical protein
MRYTKRKYKRKNKIKQNKRKNKTKQNKTCKKIKLEDGGAGTRDDNHKNLNSVKRNLFAPFTAPAAFLMANPTYTNKNNKEKENYYDEDYDSNVQESNS